MGVSTYTKEAGKEIKAGLKEGLPVTQIAQGLGVSAQTARTWIKLNDLAPAKKAKAKAKTEKKPAKKKAAPAKKALRLVG